MSVASVILDQLGGNKFRAMTGAKSFVDCGNALMFMLPTRSAQKGINKVRITLTPLDEYDIEFYKVLGVHVTLIAEAKGIYGYQLQEVFKNHTGLDTHL